MKFNIKNEYVKYFLYFLLFLAFSFGLSAFRGSDHGMAPKLAHKHFADGSGVPENILKNRKAVIYFWATWCSVCKTNLPLVKWYASLLSDSSETIFITVEEGADSHKLQNYIQENDVHFPVIVADDGMLADWKVSGFPTFFFTDKAGKIRYVDSGIVNPVSLGIRLLFIHLF